jgi:uncharacterized protein (TIGR03000 family)
MPFSGGYYATMPNQGGYYAGGWQYAAPWSGTYQPVPGGVQYAAPAAPGYYQTEPGRNRTQAGERETQGTQPGTKDTEPAKNKGTKAPGGTEEKSSRIPSITGPAPTTVEVTLPADAKLSFDGTPTRMTSAHRVFVSPPLDRGRTYYYTLTAEITRQGQPITVRERIAVWPGQTTRVTLSFPSAEATAKR